MNEKNAYQCYAGRELRVALVDGQNSYDFDIEVPSKEQKNLTFTKVLSPA